MSVLQSGHLSPRWCTVSAHDSQKRWCPQGTRGSVRGSLRLIRHTQWRSQKFFTGVRNSNWLHSPIFNRRPSLFFSRAELWQANASSLAVLPQWKLHRSCGDASWRIHDGGGTLLVAAHTPSIFSTKKVCRRWCQLRLTQAFVTWLLMKISARARGHTIFDLNDPLL